MAISTTRLVMLHTGKASSTTSYTLYSKTDLDKFPAASGYIIAPSTNYSANGTDYTNYKTSVDNQVTQIRLHSTSKPFYVGIPVINASDSYVYSSDEYERLKTFVLEINSAYSGYSNFKGFYFANERVFGTVDASSPTSNGMVLLMNNLSYLIRTDPYNAIYKEFIWAPYLGYNNTYYTINNNLGIVINRTNIFNTAFLQIGHYFTPNRGVWNASDKTGQPTKNLELAVKCVEEKKVYNYTDNSGVLTISSTPVGGSKTSSTVIGIDMETEDSLKWSQSTYATYYRAACSSFGSLFTSGTCPFMFYAGSYNGIIAAGLYKSIEQFYTDGTCELP